MFRAIISHILRSTRLCLQLVVKCTDDAASSVHFTTSCKHSLVLLRMYEIIARNMLSWLKLLIKLLLLHLVGCLYYLNISFVSFNSVPINIKMEFIKNLSPSASLDSNFSDGLNYRRIIMYTINQKFWDKTFSC